MRQRPSHSRQGARWYRGTVSFLPLEPFQLGLILRQPRFNLFTGVLAGFRRLGTFGPKARGQKEHQRLLLFGPKLIGRKIGDTEYVISAIPLGGFVEHLTGALVLAEDEPRAGNRVSIDWDRRDPTGLPGREILDGGNRLRIGIGREWLRQWDTSAGIRLPSTNSVGKRFR